MRLIICTVGTSIANGCPSLRSYQQRSTSWDDAAEDLAEEIVAKIRDIDLTAVEAVRRASAELNSLQRLGVTADDRIVLLATDTADGRCCATFLRDAISRTFAVSTDAVEVRRIAGLQVRDGKRLRDEGLSNLVSTVMRYRDQWNAEQIVLNPTGGFKGVVPFLTVLGMIFRLRTVYIFEFAEELISLPPLPLSFDAGVLERAMPALQRLQEESAIPEADYWPRIMGFQSDERDLFLSLVERDGQGYLTLSPLIEPFLRQASGTSTAVYLSKAARQTLEEAKGRDRVKLDRLLAYLAVPLWRSMHYHHFASSDLDVFKPGNVAERAACIVNNGEVFVCRLFLSHDKYEAGLAGVGRADFDLSAFVVYTPPQMDKSLAEEKREDEELARLRMEVKTLREARKRPVPPAPGTKRVVPRKSMVHPHSPKSPPKPLLPKTTMVKSAKALPPLHLREGDQVECVVKAINKNGVAKLASAQDTRWSGVFYTSSKHAAPPAGQCCPGARFFCTVKKIVAPTNVLFVWNDPSAANAGTVPAVDSMAAEDGDYPVSGQAVRCVVTAVDNAGGLELHAVEYGSASRGNLHPKSPVPPHPRVGDEYVCRVRLGWLRSMVYVWLPDGVADDEAADDGVME